MCVMMERIGVRELQHNASRILDRVKTGETIEITERGRLIAVLTPPSDLHQARARLIDEGVLQPGEGGLADWEPGPPRTDGPALSEVLLDMRAEDDR